jgi:uncharacterized protein YceK
MSRTQRISYLLGGLTVFLIVASGCSSTGAAKSEEQGEYPVQRIGEDVWSPEQSSGRGGTYAQWSDQSGELDIFLTGSTDCFDVPAGYTIESANSIDIIVPKAQTEMNCDLALTHRQFSTQIPAELNTTDHVTVSVNGTFLMELPPT